MNIIIKPNKFKEVKELNGGDIVRLMDVYYVVVADSRYFEEIILVALKTGESLKICEESLISGINDKDDSTLLVDEADLMIYNHLND